MRQALKVEPFQTLNPLLTAKKMRELSAGYVRHTIRRPIRPVLDDASRQGDQRLRLRAADYFFIFCRQIVPQIEERVEQQLLEKFKSTLLSQAERQEVQQAYLQRKDNLAKVPEAEERGEPEPGQPQLVLAADEYHKVIQSVFGDGLSYHTYKDIGRYTVFPKAMTQRMFPSVMFGRYKEDEYSLRELFGLQTREEGVRITNDLSRLTLPKDRDVNYPLIARMANTQVKSEITQDEASYVALFQDFSLSLIDYIHSRTPYEELIRHREFFNSPGVFDGLVNVLVQEMRRSPARPHLCDKGARMILIDKIVQKIIQVCEEKQIVLHEFSELGEHLQCIKVTLDKADLGPEFVDLQKKDKIQYKLYLEGYHKKCYHHWRPEDLRRVGLQKGLFKGFNTGGLLWGERGCGKSQILAYLTAWAHENSWVNMTIGSCEEFVDSSHGIDRMENGLYLQHTLAQRMLNDMKIQNEQIFREMEVDMSRYGKYDITGFHDDEGEPCPRVWDPLRQCWSDDWKNFLYDQEKKIYDQRYKELRYRIADKCPDPVKIMDIIEAGQADPMLATNAIAEILEQLYHQDNYHVLFTLDGYNNWMKPTVIDSFRYRNDPLTDHKVPPKDLALTRLFMKFDGHLIRQGVKYLTTSHYRQFNHIMTPKDIDWFTGYDHQVSNLTLNEFRNMLIFKNITDWTPFFWKEWEIERFYMETQGNYNAFHHTYYRYNSMHMGGTHYQ